MTLQNLVRIRELQIEPADRREFGGLLTAAIDRLRDAENPDLAYSSRFDLAYNAAHGLALAALRAAGYRLDKRYVVFQCLAHTVSLKKGALRLFAVCHERRNLAVYEGSLETDEQFLEELIANTKELASRVETMRAPWRAQENRQNRCVTIGSARVNRSAASRFAWVGSVMTLRASAARTSTHGMGCRKLT